MASDTQRPDSTGVTAVQPPPAGDPGSPRRGRAAPGGRPGAYWSGLVVLAAGLAVTVAALATRVTSIVQTVVLAVPLALIGIGLERVGRGTGRARCGRSGPCCWWWPWSARWCCRCRRPGRP